MTTSKKAYIEDLFRRRSEYKDPDQAETTANLLDTVSTDIYSESERFVFELIQNADDAASENANEVYFDFIHGFLVVSHTGKPFDAADIESITKAGSSSKKAKLNETGYKGIGFKSVLGKSNCVTIISNGYQFRFDKFFYKDYTQRMPWQIIPIWTENEYLQTNVQTLIVNRNTSVSTIIDINNVEILLKDIKVLLQSGEILLFLRRINKISVTHEGKEVLTIEKKTLNKKVAFNTISLFKNGRQNSSWIVKLFDNIQISDSTKLSLKQDGKTPEKLIEATCTEIAFAAKVDKGKIISLKDEESLIFTYLPTKFTEFNFPFLVNGNFLTTAAREGLHEDKMWNQWLMAVIGEKIIDWLSLFAGTEYEYQLLSLLPKYFGVAQNELKQSFDESFRKAIREKAFIPSKDSSLKKTSELIIDKTGLSDLKFIPSRILVKYINKKYSKTYDTGSFIHSSVTDEQKLGKYNLTIFDAQNLEDFFLSPIFQDNHTGKDNYYLIEYFYVKVNKEASKDWGEKLKRIPFIIADDNTLKSPESICFPSISFITDIGTTVKTIHPEVYKQIELNDNLKAWLEKLGVKDPSDEAYLENEIIPNIQNIITRDNYLTITTYLFNQHKKGMLTRLRYKQIQSLRLFTTKGELIPSNQCFLSDMYEPSILLEKVNDTCNFISNSYKQNSDLVSEWKTFFLKIGVNETIILKEIEIFTSNALKQFSRMSAFFDLNKTQEYVSIKGNKYDNPIEEYSILTYSLIELADQYEFSKLFWFEVTKTKFSREVDDEGYVDKRWQKKYNLNNNFLEWCFENAEIFPSTQKTCLKASEIFINDSDIIEIAANDLPVLDLKEALPQGWREILPFKQHLELDDYLVILVQIAKGAVLKNTIAQVDTRRIGLIYNKLANLLRNFPTSRKITINNWAINNKLLCTNNKFESINEIKWITMDGFSSLSEKLKLIEIPADCNENKATSSFIELMSLFGVQIINEFIPEIIGKSSDKTLKIRFQQILPYYAAIVGKNILTQSSSEYLRLFDLLNSTKYYSASEITLSFINNGKALAGPSLVAYAGEGSFYFKGKWKSERTLLNLIKELSNMMDVKGLDGELRFLLLETNEQEIKDWLIEKGINLKSIPARRNFDDLSAQDSESDSLSLVEVSKTSDRQTLFTEDKIQNIFQPKSIVDEIDIISIKINKNNYQPIIASEEHAHGIIENQELREKIGLWCEALVNRILLGRNDLYSEVDWVNEHGESRKPYDFYLRLADGSELFVDVKGTPSNGKDIIYLSQAEWRFMFEKAENYSIFRVYNAGEEKLVRIEEIENPSALLQAGQIFPNPITLQV